VDDASIEAANDGDDDDDDECFPYIEFCFKMKAHPTNDLNQKMNSIQFDSILSNDSTPFLMIHFPLLDLDDFPEIPKCF